MKPAALVLTDYLPYRLTIVAEAVSREVSSVYREQYKLTRDEWRILAAIGEIKVIKTRDVRRYTTLDKVQASRAIGRLEKSDLLSREEDPADRRNHLLKLTTAGKATYRALVPEVKAVEQSMLASFSKTELESFNTMLNRLLKATGQHNA
ncbi:MAG: MarR family winged helix-turn-helix transcriptional regulator [Burkholderiaceae bacterium]